MLRNPTKTPIPASLSFCIQEMVFQGVAEQRLIYGTGLAAGSYQNPLTLVSGAQELAVYSNIQRTARSPFIGLELGGAANSNSVGILGGLLKNAVNPGHMGYLMRRFNSLASTGFTVELMGELSPDHFTVRYKPAQDLGVLYRLIIDRDLRGTQAVMSEVFGEVARRFFSSIAFGYPEPTGARRYSLEFGCPVTFGHEHTYVTYDTRLSNLANSARSVLAYNLYMRLCSEAQEAFAPFSWNRSVLNVLSSGSDYPRADEMAGRLNCSERSLRRHLQAEGLHYSELVDRVRFDRATYLLSHSRDSVKKIGIQLGYSEPANFVHAFVRWAGVSPSRFRALARGGDGLPES